MKSLFVLAAGQGSRLRPLTDSVPKCMVPLCGLPLLFWHTRAARKAGMEEITVLGGYRHEKLSADIDRIVINEKYETTNMVSTLFCSEHLWKDEIFVSYGDIVFNSELMSALAAGTADVSVVVDRKWESYWHKRFDDVLADAESLCIGPDGAIESIGQKETDIGNIEGQYIGMIAFRGNGLEAMRGLIEKEKKAHASGQRLICKKRDLSGLYMTDLLQGLIDAGVRVEPVWTDGGWLEIDSPEDLELAEKMSAVENDELRIKR